MRIWLEKHHRVEPPSDLNADEVHIFANQAVGVFGDDKSDKIYYEITFNLGPVNFKVKKISTQSRNKWITVDAELGWTVLATNSPSALIMRFR